MKDRFHAAELAQSTQSGSSPQCFDVFGAGEAARSRLVEATPAGHTKRADGQRAWKAAQTALNEKLDAQRVAALHELLDCCIACFDEADQHEIAS